MKRRVLGMALAASFALTLPFASHAWEPAGDVSVIVAYKAGSGTDKTCRPLIMMAEKYVGKTLVIHNMPGGDGKIGWTDLIKAKPDGRTIGFVNLPTFTQYIAEGKFKVDQIVPVCNHVTETGVIVVKADSPYKTLDDLVAAMKKNPRLKASTNGNRASNHISAQLFANSAKVKYKAIPYGGTADQLLALRQGEVDFSCPKIADVASMIHGDKPELRVLGVFDTKRDATIPNVPTLKELGYYPEWYGSARAIVLPKGAKPEIVKFYADAFLKTMQDKECAELHHKAGFNMDYKNPKELADLIQAQINFCQMTVKPDFWK